LIIELAAAWWANGDLSSPYALSVTQSVYQAGRGMQELGGVA
jgi:hypothetical protein